MPDTPQFVPGQRWVCATMPDLGLGMVLRASGREVTLLWPAAGEERTYAVRNAPLVRLVHRVGDAIRDAEGNSYRVLALEERQGRIIYQVVDEEGEQLALPEQLLDSTTALRRPAERLFGGQIDRNASFELRVATLEALHRLNTSPVRGLLGARVQLLPHQLYIARQVSRRHAPCVLLADEVGLGKTIEAGLILHQMVVTGRVSRALVLVPQALQFQWLVEMLRRFNLRFTLLNQEQLEGQEEGNPWQEAQLVISPLELLAGDPVRQQQALQAGWDMLIVDEAHHLVWAEENPSPEYCCVERLAMAVPSVLLLTATPEQLGREGHYARLRLLDPDRYPSLEQYLAEEADYESIAGQVEYLQELGPGMLIDRARLPDLEPELLQHLGEVDGPAFEERRQEAISALLDRHGTGRVLFRNTRESVGGFPERALHPHPLLLPEGAEGKSLADWLQPERLFADDWLEQDPRVAWLADWLDRQQGKVLLICASARTAAELEEYLRVRGGRRTALFTEQMTLVQRDRAAAWFADPDYGADLLVCSEIGSEGRNFQFAHKLVLFDLPQHPDLLEQRIGRLDRIGQTETVEIHLPFFEGTPQEHWLRWLHEGLNAFVTPCATGAKLGEEFAERLEQALLDGGDALETLIGDTRRRAEALGAEMARGRNRLLELNSFDPKAGQAIAQAIATAEDPEGLERYLELLFDHYGVDYQPQGDGLLVIRPSEQMLTDAFPELDEEGMTATFWREQALGREDVAYLSWEHPLVEGAMELVAESEAGNAALCTLRLPPLKPGTLLLEACFRLRLSAPRRLQLGRFLPAASWRVLLTPDGKNLAEVLPHQKLNALVGVIGREPARRVIGSARGQIEAMIAQAERLAEGQREGWLHAARASIVSEFAAEHDRLVALAQLNPAVRPEELVALRAARDEALAALEHALLQPDALRVILVTE